MSQFKDKNFAEVLEALREKNIYISVEDKYIHFYTEDNLYFYQISFNILKKIISSVAKASKLNIECKLNEEEFQDFKNKFKQILLDLDFEVRE